MTTRAYATTAAPGRRAARARLRGGRDGGRRLPRPQPDRQALRAADSDRADPAAGPSNSIAYAPVEQLGEEHPHLCPGQRGTDAEVLHHGEGDVPIGVRVTSNSYGSVNTSSSRLAEGSQSTTLSPGAIRCPPSSYGRVAVRTLWVALDVHRMISSIALGNSARPASERRLHCCGCSSNACPASTRATGRSRWRR